MSDSVIREDDDIILFLDSKRTYLIKVRKGLRFHTHKGFVNFDDMIGKRYGDRIKSSLGTVFFLLKPGIYDYVRKMVYKTQIIYPNDIALIVAYTGIGPGSKIVEAGTGSGALTSALAHYVRPTGKIYSYELRSEFIENARKNILRAGVLEYVELKIGDIAVKIDEENVDALILDLATPWMVVPNAYKVLRGGGSFISFSPTIEQVIETVETLKISGFIDVETIECFIRRIKVKRGETRPEFRMRGHTGYIVSARKIFPEKLQNQEMT